MATHPKCGNLPVTTEELVFNVEMALRGASKLWPKRRLPGDHDRLKPMANAIVAHLDLCGIRCCRRPPPPRHSAPGGGSEYG